MKSSRALLFAALMTVTAPFFASDAPKKETKTESTTPVEPGMMLKIGNGMWAFVTFPFIAAPDYISSITLGKIASMECLKGGNVASVLNNPWTGRVAVWAAVVALYLQVKKLQAQDDNDDQQFLFEDENN